jgi:hypothetical protein
MQPLIDLILTLTLRLVEIMDTGNPLLLRRKRPRFLLAEEILFLSQSFEASALAVVGWGW